MSIPDWSHVREQIARKLAEDRRMVAELLAQQEQPKSSWFSRLVAWWVR